MTTITEHNLRLNRTFQPVLPLSSTVTGEMRAKIWANEFMKFSQLLSDGEKFDKVINSNG